MLRETTLEEISDGQLYNANDLVKADCHDCVGCSECCKGMGNTIVLTPYDIYLLTTGLKCSFEQLLNQYIELNVVDGVILPNLKLSGEKGQCGFLNEEGRCSIHPFRPDICRLFPLGRIYEEDGFHYFLQTKECIKENRTKIKVKKWLGIPQIEKNEKFIFRWHELIKHMREFVAEGEDLETAKAANMRMLQIFYVTPYEDNDFYEQVEKRFQMLGIL